MRKFILLILSILHVVSFARGSEYTLFSNFRWESEYSISQEGRGWQHQGILPYTYQYSIMRIKKHLADHDYQEKHCIEGKRDGKKNMLGMWMKGKRQLMIMVTQIETDKVLVSWGEVPND